MAIFEVEIEGQKYDVDAPDDKTAWAWANQSHLQYRQGVAGDVSRMRQEGALRRGLRGAGASAQNALYGIRGLVSDLTPEQRRQIDVNKQFLEEDTAGKVGGFAADVASFALPGGLVAKGVTKALPMLPRAAQLASGITANAAADAGLSAAYATEDRGQAALMGGLSSVAGQGIARGLTGVVKPSARAQQLMAEGVQPTIGQAADQGTFVGRRIAKAEEAAQSLPVLGDVITESRGRAQNELVQAAANRAVPPGGTAQVPTREGLDELYKQFNKSYRVLDNFTFKPDPQIEQEVLSIVTNPNYRASRETIDGVLDFFEGNYTKKFQQGPQGVGAFLSGEGFKDLDSEIGRRIRDLAGDTSREALAERRMLTAIEGSVGRWRDRNLPAPVVDQLKDTDRAYAAWKRLARAGRYSNEGDIRPSQLTRAVKAMSKGDEFARGQAFMQDLTDAGSILANRVPNSGTADRLAEAGLLTSLARNPAGTTAGVLAAGTIGTPAYSRAGQRMLLGGYDWQRALQDALRRKYGTYVGDVSAAMVDE